MMAHSFFRLIIALGLIGVPMPIAVAQTSQSDAEAVATFPNGTFLENLSVRPQGEVLFTSYADQTVLRWTGSGSPSPWARLDVHPVAVLPRQRDVILTAHGDSFLAGSSFTMTQQFLILGLDGLVQRRIPAPDARFLNGMVEAGPDMILAADSILGRIWRLTPSTGIVTPWLDGALLGQDSPSARPGVNGLKINGQWLYFSNSARGGLYRVRIGNAQPAGDIELVAQTGPIDDFAFLPNGDIAATTHGPRLLRIQRDGNIMPLLEHGCDGCTAVVLFRGQLLVTTTGNLLERGSEPARLLRLSVPEH